MICPDASIAIKWFVDEEHEEHHAQARMLFRDAQRAAEPIIAPVLLRIEVSNILRQRVRRSLLTPDEALALFDEFLAGPIQFLNPQGLSRRALTLANTYNLPAAYDAHYLGFAQLYGCDFWTSDRRLVNTLAGRLPFVRWVGDYDS